MKRREVITLLGSMAVAWPFAALRQRKSNSYRIGYLALLTGERTPLAKVFLQRLHELGYSEDKNMVFEYRSAEGQADRVPALAAELVRADPDVLVAGFGNGRGEGSRSRHETHPDRFHGCRRSGGGWPSRQSEPPWWKYHGHERAGGRTIGQAAATPQRPHSRQEAVRGASQPRHPQHRAGAPGSQDSRRGERATIRRFRSKNSRPVTRRYRRRGPVWRRQSASA